MTTGTRMKLRRKELEIPVEEIAKALGVSIATVYRYENGDIEKLPGTVLEPLATVLRTTPAYLMGWEEPDKPDTIKGILPLPNFHKVPRLGTIACGDPILAEENIEGYDDVPDYIRADFTLVCHGDSMINARIFDGDIVCIRQCPTVDSGSIAAVLIDDEATLKRVLIFDDHIILQPENPTHKPLVFWGEDMNRVRILGLATHFISPVK